jgi:hypothetical protein
MWVGVYLALLAGASGAGYYQAEQIKTHGIPVGQIKLIIPYSKYMVGEAVSFSIENHYNSDISITNKCPSEPLAVYYKDGNSWVRQHDSAATSDCASEQRQVTIAANGVVNGTFAPWHNLFTKPGTYRIVAPVQYYDTLPYQDIEVLAYPVLPVPPAIVVKPKVTTTAKTTTTTQSNYAQPVTTTTTTTTTTPAITPAPTTTKTSKTVTTTSGTINIQYDTTTIYVISIAPASGCTYEGGNNGSNVQVTFICGQNQLQVDMLLRRGTVRVSTQSGN